MAISTRPTTVAGLSEIKTEVDGGLHFNRVVTKRHYLKDRFIKMVYGRCVSYRLVNFVLHRKRVSDSRRDVVKPCLSTNFKSSRRHYANVWTRATHFCFMHVYIRYIRVYIRIYAYIRFYNNVITIRNATGSN